MRPSLRTNYRHTIYASYLGYITQAIINNFVPLLFLTFQTSFQISFQQISLLVMINFGIQLAVDLLAARYVDRIGYRKAVVAAHILCTAGLVGLAVFPGLFPSPYLGILTAVSLYAVGGGLIEVLISPIVEACPTDRKEAAMSLLHSFYCWGHVFVILASTLFFVLCGMENWRVLACIWAVFPAVNALYFSQVPLNTLVAEEEKHSLKDLFRNNLFWIFFLLMACAGASEQGMSQWASAFAESGLGITKAVGDLAGPCLFAALMGVSRAFYAKMSHRIRLNRFMALSGLLCVGCYLLASLSKIPAFGLLGCALCGLSVGILWPGTFSMASPQIPKGGTALFALLALAGDLGCMSGPALIGVGSQAMGGNLQKGLLLGVFFPSLLLAGLFLLWLVRRSKTAREEE